MILGANQSTYLPGCCPRNRHIPHPISSDRLQCFKNRSDALDVCELGNLWTHINELTHLAQDICPAGPIQAPASPLGREQPAARLLRLLSTPYGPTDVGALPQRVSALPRFSQTSQRLFDLAARAWRSGELAGHSPRELIRHSPWLLGHTSTGVSTWHAAGWRCERIRGGAYNEDRTGMYLVPHYRVPACADCQSSSNARTGSAGGLTGTEAAPMQQGLRLRPADGVCKAGCVAEGDERRGGRRENGDRSKVGARLIYMAQVSLTDRPPATCPRPLTLRPADFAPGVPAPISSGIRCEHAMPSGPTRPPSAASVGAAPPLHVFCRIPPSESLCTAY